MNAQLSFNADLLMNLRERLKLARKNAKKTQKQVADAVNMTQSNYSQLETGSALKSVFLPAIANYLGVDALWLESGEESRAAQFIRVEAWDSNTPLDDDEVEIPFYKDFLVACGHGSNGEALESETRRLRLSKATLKGKGILKNHACAVTATDDSMSPTINDGNTVYLDTGRNTIKNGKVFVIEFDGKDGSKIFRCKRLYSLPLGGVRIVSDNEDEYPEERFTAEQLAAMNFKVVGWAFSWQTLENW